LVLSGDSKASSDVTRSFCPIEYIDVRNLLISPTVQPSSSMSEGRPKNANHRDTSKDTKKKVGLRIPAQSFQKFPKSRTQQKVDKSAKLLLSSSYLHKESIDPQQILLTARKSSNLLITKIPKLVPKIAIGLRRYCV